MLMKCPELLIKCLDWDIFKMKWSNFGTFLNIEMTRIFDRAWQMVLNPVVCGHPTPRAGAMVTRLTSTKGAGIKTITEYKTMVTEATAVAVNTGSHRLCMVIMLVINNNTNSTINSSNTTVNINRCPSSNNLSRKITKFPRIRENLNNPLLKLQRIFHYK